MAKLESCGARTDKGGINLYIELERHELNQIDGRNVRTSPEKCIAFSK